MNRLCARMALHTSPTAWLVILLVILTIFVVGTWWNF